MDLDEKAKHAYGAAFTETAKVILTRRVETWRRLSERTGIDGAVVWELCGGLAARIGLLISNASADEIQDVRVDVSDDSFEVTVTPQQGSELDEHDEVSLSEEYFASYIRRRTPALQLDQSKVTDQLVRITHELSDFDYALPGLVIDKNTIRFREYDEPEPEPVEM